MQGQERSRIWLGREESLDGCVKCLVVFTDHVRLNVPVLRETGDHVTLNHDHASVLKDELSDYSRNVHNGARLDGR